MAASIRTFGGETYILMRRCRLKSEAAAIARGIRAKGARSRMVKDGRAGYVIYKRAKD